MWVRGRGLGMCVGGWGWGGMGGCRAFLHTSTNVVTGTYMKDIYNNTSCILGVDTLHTSPLRILYLI